MWNINIFLKENNGENKAKLDIFKHLLITSSDCNILLMSEHNIFEWLKSTSESMYEQGGTDIVMHSRSLVHTIASEGDSRKMGRGDRITQREG